MVVVLVHRDQFCVAQFGNFNRISSRVEGVGSALEEPLVDGEYELAVRVLVGAFHLVEYNALKLLPLLVHLVAPAFLQEVQTVQQRP